MKVFLISLLIICGMVYVLSCIEIIGSYYLTKKLHGVRLVCDTILFPILFPPAAPMWLYSIISEAQEAYDHDVVGDYYPQESLLEYIRHGRVGYMEWNERKKLAIVKR